MRELLADGIADDLRVGGHMDDMLVGLTAFLTRTGENDRRSKIAGVTDEAAGVADGAGGVRQHAQVIFGRQVDQRAQPFRLVLVAEGTNRLRDVIGTGVDVRPEQHGLLLDLIQPFEQRLHLHSFPAELGRRRMKQHEHVGLVHVDERAAALGVDDLRLDRPIQHARDVTARAADAENRIGPFAHANDVFRRAPGAGKMEVRELRDGVTRAFVDGAGDFTALDVRDADVHVGGGQRGGQRLVAITDDQHNVGLEPLKFAGELNHAEADGLGHRGRRGAFQFNVNLAVHREAILAHDIHRLVEAFQHHGAGGDHLQLDGRMILEGAHDRLEPAVIRAIHQHDTDFSFLHN